jgi:hypothetical protein
MKPVGAAPPHQQRMPARVEGMQIHTQRNGDGVRRTDPIELFPRESGGADHDVVVRRSAFVRDVGYGKN